MDRLRTEELPSVPTLGAGMDRGLSQIPSLLGPDGPSAQWGMPNMNMGGSLTMPLGGLGGSGSLNGSLNAHLNDLIQQGLESQALMAAAHAAAGGEPPAKVQRTDAGPQPTA